MPSHSTEWFFIAQIIAKPTPRVQINMLRLIVDGPQTNGRLNMPVQQIELEEVAMIEVSDDLLEKICPSTKVYTGQATACCTQQTVCAC